MKTLRDKMHIFLVLCLTSIAISLAGCGGGSSRESSQAQNTTDGNLATISGRVTVQGETDYSGVVVVAERMENGVTARVAAMIKAAEKGDRTAEKTALALEDGVYATTDKQGDFTLKVPPGSYSVSALKNNTIAARPQTVVMRTASTVTVNFELVATGKITGKATLGYTTGNTGIVAFVDGTSYAAYADDAGVYTISNVPVGTYTLKALDSFGYYPGFKSLSGVAVTSGATATVSDMQLTFATPVLNEWLAVAAGDFVMGCAIADVDCNSDESPAHTVTLSAYSIQKKEVTWHEYGLCVRSGECEPPSDAQGPLGFYYNGERINHPVMHLSWYNAKEYCVWAGGRLPTEAEWEKAARGPSPRESIYPWGDAAPTCSLANISVNDNCVDGTSVAGSYPAGASYYGAMDMAGNVWEWVSDLYDEFYYASSPAVDPQGPAIGDSRIMRGGAWDSGFWNVRNSARRDLQANNTVDYFIGVRCARN